MEFFRRAPGSPQSLAILAGTFNPPTLAHLALARAALAHAGEVLFALPRAFPHKGYEGASFSDRVRMLEAALAPEPRYSIAAAAGGLFIDMALEARRAYGPHTALWLVCGRDAAERIVAWDYGSPGAIDRMLDVFGLLVAGRGGDYVPPARLAGRVRRLEVDSRWDSVSATEIRRRVSTGEAWEALAPPEIVPLVREIYGGA